MQSEFEKELQERMQDFKLSPSPQVWQQVAAALPEEKRKRRFAFWWLLPMGLLLGGGMWYAFTAHQKKIIGDHQLPVATTQTNNTTPAPKAAEKDSQKVAQYSETPIATVTIQPPLVPANKNTEASKNSNAIVSNQDAKPITNRLQIPRLNGLKKSTSNSKRDGVQHNTKEEPTKGIAAIIALNYQAATNGHIYNNNTINNHEPDVQIVTPDSAVKKPLAQSVAASSKSLDTSKWNASAAIGLINSNDTTPSIIANNTKPQVLTQSNKNKQVNWQLFGAVGVSNTGAKLLGNQNKDLAYSAFNTSTGQGNIRLDAAHSSPTSGLSFTLGINRVQLLGKHWQWYTAIQYSYISNHQKTGARKDSAIVVFDNPNFTTNGNATTAVMVPNYYATGGSMQHTNYVHQLGLETGMMYTLNATSKKPISIRGGIVANWQASMQQLLYNSNKNIYYYDLHNTKKIALATLVGVDWRLSPGLTIGAFFECHFTPISKLEIGTNSYWRHSGLRLSMPVRKVF